MEIILVMLMITQGFGNLGDAFQQIMHRQSQLTKIRSKQFFDRAASRYDRVKKHQLDAQLILSIFRQPVHVSGVSRPIISCLLSWLDCSNPTRTTESHLKKYQIPIVVHIRLYFLMMGLETPETCTGWRNILRISFASSWFFFTRWAVLDLALLKKLKNGNNYVLGSFLNFLLQDWQHSERKWLKNTVVGQ